MSYFLTCHFYGQDPHIYLLKSMGTKNGTATETIDAPINSIALTTETYKVSGPAGASPRQTVQCCPADQRCLGSTVFSGFLSLDFAKQKQQKSTSKHRSSIFRPWSTAVVVRVGLWHSVASAQWRWEALAARERLFSTDLQLPP